MPGWRPLPLKETLRSLKDPFRLRSARIRRSPSSTSALTVVFSCAARRFACSSSELGISTVVFMWVDVSEDTARLQAVGLRPERLTAGASNRQYPME